MVRSWVLKFGPVIARAAAAPSPAEQPMASGRDGCPDRWLSDVPLARRRPRGRDPRLLVQRRRDTRAALRLMRKLLKKQIAGDRQAALLCLGVPALTTELSARTGASEQQSRRELASACTATRAQDAVVQIGSIRSALPQHARRRSQHLQPSTPSRLAVDTADLPSRGDARMAECSRGSVIARPARAFFDRDKLI